MNYTTEQLLDILANVHEPAQIKILLGLNLESLIPLAREDTQLGKLIGSTYVLKDLAAVHNFPIPKDLDQFLRFSSMGPDELLQYCTRRGYVEIIEKLIETKFEQLNWYDCMLTAIDNCQLSIVKLLVKAPIDKLFDSDQMECNICKVLEHDDADLLKFLVVDHGSPDASPYMKEVLKEASDIEYILRDAVFGGYFNIVNMLIPLLELEHSEAMTETVVHENQLETCKLLLERGVDPNKILGQACGSGKPEILILLLENGVTFDINSAVKAAEKGRTEIIELLIKNIDKLSPQAKPESLLKNAMAGAAREGHISILSSLIEMAISPEHMAKSLNNALVEAVSENLAYVVKFLLSEIKKRGYTSEVSHARSLAVEKNYIEIIKLLQDE